MNAINWLVDRIHVATSDEDVAAEFVDRCQRAGKGTEDTAQVVRLAILRHHENQAQYSAIHGPQRLDNDRWLRQQLAAHGHGGI